ncbi:sugar transferase [Pseudooceanicola aestuarii]|uniref:sugar transferase n=1 Tax=Pseudooceanicola aestuarii TaxID=2697319 RepID=UPI0013D43E6E|nr:sugar transferase [Pseudooceanicola aestuarii]
MTWRKRFMDVVLALTLAMVLAPLALGIALAVLLRDGRPVFHVSERMASPNRRFRLVKFRTMRPDPGDIGVCGGAMRARITPLGAGLRRSRLDEVPQLWNILRGDMSFVGPRPPLPEYVDAFPALYARVLRMRPGLTGLGTLLWLDREAALLSGARTAGEADQLYRRHCLPAKARLDLIHARRCASGLDLWIMICTVLHLSPLPLRVTPRLRLSTRAQADGHLNQPNTRASPRVQPHLISTKGGREEWCR